MNWLDVDHLAEQAVVLGWNGKWYLPARVEIAIRMAAHAAPLPTPTEGDLVTARQDHRTQVAVWVGLGVVVCGVSMYGALTEGQPDRSSTLALVFVSVLLIVGTLVAQYMWSAEPRVVFAKRERRKLVTAARGEVLSRAAEIRRSTVAVTSVFMTPRDAEYLAAQIMTNLGAKNVRVTQATRDGGLDVEADGFVAEVKHYAAAVPAAPVHRIFGVAQSRGSRALFFTLTGYRPEAVTFAETAGVALFTYDPATGAVVGHSTAARTALRNGL